MPFGRFRNSYIQRRAHGFSVAWGEFGFIGLFTSGHLLVNETPNVDSSGQTERKGAI